MAPGTVIVTPPPPSPSAREHERRATELLEGGKRDEATLAFDGLVMNNPLYEPRTTEMTPEALATFRQSQRRILPLKAQGNYDRGKAALSGGDYDMSLDWRERRLPFWIGIRTPRLPRYAIRSKT